MSLFEAFHPAAHGYRLQPASGTSYNSSKPYDSALTHPVFLGYDVLFDYSWSQTTEHINIRIPLSTSTTKADLWAIIEVATLMAGFRKVHSCFLDINLWGKINVENSRWLLERDTTKTHMEFELEKADPTWWPYLTREEASLQTANEQVVSDDTAMELGNKNLLMWADHGKRDADLDAAIKYYQIACSRGVLTAQLQLAKIYADPDIFNNAAKAIEYYELAALQGDIESQFQLAMAYSTGEGVPKNFQKAVLWYESIIQHGPPHSVTALFRLGNLYQRGMPEGDQNSALIEPDYHKALACWMKAGELNSADAIFNIGILYLNGWGLHQDEEKATALFVKALNLDPTVKSRVGETSRKMLEEIERHSLRLKTAGSASPAENVERGSENEKKYSDDTVEWIVWGLLTMGAAAAYFLYKRRLSSSPN
eukprot:GILK01009796.1.p1 GENE.GILK01009796.1~~GILK01009796.1.p1  ORF type:complete len:424 (+),score=51.52 GILK01009796.1:43-1314(+)